MDRGQSGFLRERFWAALETQRAPPWMSVLNRIPVSAILKVVNRSTEGGNKNCAEVICHFPVSNLSKTA